MTFPILGGNGAVAGAFSIDNSLRLNDDDTPKLAITPNASNRKTWTFSAWVKRSSLSSNQRILSITGTNDFLLRFRGDDKLSFIDGSITSELITATKVFRDTSAWYHIVIVLDTTQGTASNRAKLYVNGYQETDLVNNSGGSASYPSQNADGLINSNVLHTVGCRDISGTVDQNVDGYMAEVHFIDGTAKSPTDFGEFDEDSGIWKPIEYTGTYGTNGFYLDFENSGSLGADSSGNGNNFTPTNLASTDQMIDTPTNNWCTFNSITATATGLSEGNLKSFIDGDASSYPVNVGTIPMTSGKWYAEVYCVSGSFPRIGIFNVEADSTPDNLGGTSAGWCILNNASRKFHNGGASSYGSFTLGSGEIVGIAYDADNGKVWFSKNGTFVGTVDSSGEAFSGISGQITWAVADASSGSTQILNAGQDSSFAGSTTRQNNSDDNGFGDFYYAPPSGYLALCTQNLATELSPTIDDGSDYFQTALYTGNGSTNNITNVGFQSDFVWIKERNNARSHCLYDSSRGATLKVNSDSSQFEVTDADGLTAFSTDGFTLGADSSTNGSGNTYASWNWKANAGTTSSNTDGSVTSTVQANTTAGFSIVNVPTTGSVLTFGHGLGVAPKMVMLKSRDKSDYWGVYHASLGATKFLRLNTTDLGTTASGLFNNTEPTSTVFTMGTENALNNASQETIAYCFAEIEGYSKFGSYTGNGSTDGTFIYTGFKPAFVMTKRTDSTNQWTIFDSGRDPFNVVGNQLAPNTSNAEEADASHSSERDFLSNGFKMRAGGNDTNASGGTYIYITFGHTFVDSNGVPNTAR